MTRRRFFLATFLAFGTAMASPASAGLLLDSSFGSNGIAAVPAPDGLSFLGDVALDAEDRPVAVGSVFAQPGDGATAGMDLFVSRLTADGGVDTSFGDDGFSVLAGPDQEVGARVEIQPDGKILVLGSSIPPDATDASVSETLIVRFLATGAIDTSFGEEGVLALTTGDAHATIDIAVQPDGKILLATVEIDTSAEPPTSSIKVRRFTADGAADLTYGPGGEVVLLADRPGWAGDLAVDSQGRTLVAVTTEDGTGVLRLSPLGTPDPGFGNEGLVVQRVAESESLAARVVELPDGSIIVGTTSFSGTSALMKFTADGQADEGFGRAGVRTLGAPGGVLGYVRSISADDSGAVTVLHGAIGNANRFLLTRLVADGRRDQTVGAIDISQVVGDSVVGAGPHLPDSEGRTVLGVHPRGAFFGPPAVARFEAPGALRVRSGAPPVMRLAGDDRIGTSIAAARAAFPDGTQRGGVPGVVLASAANFPDALVGAPLAAAMGGPLLLSDSQALDPRVEAEIDRLMDPGAGRVTILGGENAISGGIAGALAARGYAVERIAGADRYETAALVARSFGIAQGFVLATGENFPDALAAGAAARAIGGVVLLTQDDTMPESTKAVIESFPEAPRYAAGGPAAAADPDAQPIVGEDRYDTSAKLAELFFVTPGHVGIASGESFADAVTGGAFAAYFGGPLLLSRAGELPEGATAFLDGRGGFVDGVFTFGGNRVLGDGVLTAARAAAG